MALSTVTQCFDAAQKSFATHRKCTEALAKLRETDPESFDNEFFSCVCCILPVGKREPAIERLVEFVVKFATQHGGEAETDDDFVQGLVSRLLPLTSASDKSVRSRATQLVGRVFNSMSEEAEVSDELFESVERSMLMRCRDKIPSVRAFAVRALFRLQDPSSRSDEITSELLRLMADDASKEVRMAALSTIAPSRHAIEAILIRTRDVSAEVRMFALRVLRDKVEMRWLSISQRTSLLAGSLLDRDSRVAAVAAELLTAAWLRKFCEGDVLALLKALDPVTHDVAAQNTIAALLQGEAHRPLVAEAAKQWGTLQLEAVYCLRAYVQALATASPRAEEELETVLPTSHDFCEALRRAVAACDEAEGSVDSVRSICCHTRTPAIMKALRSLRSSWRLSRSFRVVTIGLVGW